MTFRKMIEQIDEKFGELMFNKYAAGNFICSSKDLSVMAGIQS